ncbi:MAG: hypothetical protein Q9168_001683 [Polycauliona sp. 1 TL-2023]
MAKSSSNANQLNNPVGWCGVAVVRKKRVNTADLAVPTPLPFDSLYTVSCVQARANYINQRLNSKNHYLTPNSQKLLTIYLNQCLAFLRKDVWIFRDKIRAIDDLRRFEIDIADRRFLHEISSPDLLKELVEFRQYSYWVRYKDFAAPLVAQLRKIATQKPATMFVDRLSGTCSWHEISKAIRDESNAWKSSTRGPDLTSIRTTYAVYENCQRAGINFDEMIRLIHLYAENNQAFHSGFQHDIKKANYWDIAARIYRDIIDLSSVCSPTTMAPDELGMWAALRKIRDEWFDASRDFDNPQAWIWKPALNDLRNQLLQNETTIAVKGQGITKKAAAWLRIDLDGNEELNFHAARDGCWLYPEGTGLRTIAAHGNERQLGRMSWYNRIVNLRLA